VNPMDIRTDPLPEPVQGPVRELAELIIGLAGDNLRGLAVFGQATGEDYAPSTTLVRSTVVLGGMDLQLLDQLRRCGMRLGRRHHQRGLEVTPQYIDESRDSFPLELLEIQQNHVMVVGPDIFSELAFDPRDVRLQAERELKGELIALRQGLLASSGKDKLLAPLCRDALGQAIRVLRGVLWLAKAPICRTDAAILAGAQELTRIDLASFREVQAGSARSDFVSFQRFYRDVERLSDYVNHMEA